MELRHRGSPRLKLSGFVALVFLLLAFPAAAHAVNPTLPPSQTEPPKYFKHSGEEVARIAERASKVQEARRDGPLAPTSYTRGYGRWQVSFFRDGKEVVQVQVDDASGAILELLVSVAGMAELPAQAISIAAATPLNFLGNKMWSFAIEVHRD